LRSSKKSALPSRKPCSTFSSVCTRPTWPSAELTAFSEYCSCLCSFGRPPRHRRWIKPDLTGSTHEPPRIPEIRQPRWTRDRSSFCCLCGRGEESAFRERILRSQGHSSQRLSPTLDLQSSSHTNRESEIPHHRHAFASRAQDRRGNRHVDQEYG